MWYHEKGPLDEIVISTRVRLARNFKDYPFPLMLDTKSGNAVKNILSQTLPDSISGLYGQLFFIDMESTKYVDKQVMVEKHLISPNLLQDASFRGVIMNDKQNISIMINEEDHLRIQCFLPGMQLDAAWDMADKIDNILDEKIDYAFDETLGYITSCPTNLGTGLRASVMVHLPALSMTGYLSSVLTAVNKLGIAVRGIYGEGSNALGNIFQISNQETLGQSEHEIIEKLRGIANQVISQEKTAAAKLMKDNGLKLEDRLNRSYGVLTNARLMSTQEFMELYSDVRLGVNLGIINNVSLSTLNELLVITQPANIMKQFSAEQMTLEQRDTKRAELVRNQLSK